MSSIEEEVIKYCISRNLCLVTKENLEMMHRPIVVETKNKDAIPIEWLDTYCTDSDIGLRDNDPIAIRKLVEDWEAENGDKN